MLARAIMPHMVISHQPVQSTKPPSRVARALGLTYALAAFLLALALFLYAIPFLGNLRFLKRTLVNPTIDIGQPGSVVSAVLIDAFLILLFGLQHSLMARDAFKRWLARYIADGLERTTYVHASNLVLWPVLLFWQPIPIVIVDLSVLHAVMMSLFWSGWLIVLVSAINIDLLELWGLRPAWSWSRGESYQPPPFKESWFYSQVRHPIYLGLLIAFWATPQLTAGHALFAVGLSAYIFIGAWFEERDLVRKYGEAYSRYQRNVPAYLPAVRSRPGATGLMRVAKRIVQGTSSSSRPG